MSGDVAPTSREGSSATCSLCSRALIIDGFVAFKGQDFAAVICDSGPLANTAHHPAWGRISETYGEDPYLIAQTGVAVTRTMQGLENGTLKNA